MNAPARRPLIASLNPPGQRFNALNLRTFAQIATADSAQPAML
jgi:hypothetical protein